MDYLYHSINLLGMAKGPAPKEQGPKNIWIQSSQSPKNSFSAAMQSMW